MNSIEEVIERAPIKPHGGKLVNRELSGAKKDALAKDAESMPKIMVDLEAIITMEMIATGVLSPNQGFMVHEDYESVLNEGRLANGTPWPVPLSFAPSGQRNAETVASLKEGDRIALIDRSKKPIAVLNLEDNFSYDREDRAQKLFGTRDRSHPGVDSIFRRMGERSLGGKIDLIERVHWGPFEDIRKSPEETWRYFYEEKKWKSVVGFITGANPVHRGHEYMHKTALETNDGLLIQPLVEMAKHEYVRNEFRLKGYDNVINTYYPREHVLLAPLRVTYIFAGPREAVLHALIEKNFGCTSVLIGRDHAGVGSFYDTYACQNVFEQYNEKEIGIKTLFFNEVFYCTRCAQTATERTCPHGEKYRIKISGTGVREILRWGFLPPKEIARPESGRIALQGIQPKGIAEDGQAIYPVGATVKKLFPYYMVAHALGGPMREKPLKAEDLTKADLLAALLEVRSKAHEVYADVADHVALHADVDRTLVPAWLEQETEDALKQQENLIESLEKKFVGAPEEASDPFMYQDKAEAKRELDVAKRILDELPKPVSHESFKKRVWNQKKYEEHR
ncbi:MAG: sulfate adenylyltransferase [Candidatus Micrarchaeia archaeon]